MDDLADRVAVVLGGGSGIGRATARALSREGVRVAIGDRDRDRAEAAAAEIRLTGAEATAHQCDVTIDADLIAIREFAKATWDRVDIVMNNVGLPVAGLPLDIPLSAWQRNIEVNLLSVVRSNDVFLPTLLAQGEGHIVNTASAAGLYAYSYHRLPYSATKAAVVALSEALALYLRPLGIGVTCLCPGTVQTNIAESIEVFGPRTRVPAPGFDVLSADTVGDMTVEAIRANTFLLLTNPEIADVLRWRADDPEAFLQHQVVAARPADS